MLRQSAIVLALSWFAVALQFVVSILLARLFGPEGKGVLAVLAGATAVLTSVAMMGIPSGAAALFRRPGVDRGAIVSSAVALTLLSCALVLLVFLSAGEHAIALLLGDRQVLRIDPVWVWLAVAATLPGALATLGDVLLIAANAMRLYAWRSATIGLLSVTLTWLLVWQMNWGLTGALIAPPLAQVVGLGLITVWWARGPDLRGFRVRRAESRALLVIGIQQHALSLIALVAKRIDVFLIASLLTLEDAGYYAVAVLLPTAVMTVPRATMWPLVAALSEDGARKLTAMTQASRMQVALMLLGTLCLFPFVPLAVKLLFGDAFAAAAGPMRLALLGAWATPLTISVNAYLTALGRPGLSISAAAVGTSVQLAITLFYIREWGVAASAVAFSANHLVTAALQVIVLKTQQRVSAREMLIPTVADFTAIRRAISGA